MEMGKFHPEMPRINAENSDDGREKEQERDLTVIDRIIEDHNRPISPIFDFSDKKEVMRMESTIDRLSEHDKSLRRLLELYGIRSEIKKVGEHLYAIPIRSESGLDEIGSRYAYKGGAARSLLLRELGIDKYSVPRDIDLAKVREGELDETDMAMAEKYSPDDFHYGYGMETLEGNYFDSRDFTMNEVLAHDGNIYLTKQCLLDTVRRVIRFSDFEKEKLSEAEKKGSRSYFDKLMAKALRFAAAEIAKGKEMEIADGKVYEYLEIRNFHIALHLDRALGQGYQVALEYIGLMKEKGQLPDYEGSPDEILRQFASDATSEGGFVFRFAPENVFRTDAEIIESIKDGSDKLLSDPEMKEYATQVGYEDYDRQ